MGKFYNAMKTIRLSLVCTVRYYTPLLERYARRLINNEWEAILLVNDVLEDLYEIDKLETLNHLRQLLKFDLCNRCFYFIQSQIFDRPLLKNSTKQKKYEHRIIQVNKTQ